MEKRGKVKGADEGGGRERKELERSRGDLN